jgi:hypothetical protein
MNSLSPTQELHAGDQLVSNNGIFVLEMRDDGALSLYRKQLRWSMWAGPALNQPGGFAVMQNDGNFVCYSAAGVPYWASNTDGHPGAWLALLDNGNLVVLGTGAVADTDRDRHRQADDPVHRRWRLLVRRDR